MQRWTGDGTEDDSRVAVGDALGVEGFALNRYRLPPGAGLPGGLHTHLDQEELFVVLQGRLTFETLSGAVTVASGEAVRFAPGEYQSGANEGDTVAVVLAAGAPKESEAVRVPLDCPDCGERGLTPELHDGEVMLACPACGVAHRTRGCPACEREELRVAASGGETVVVCPDCGAELPEPRWRE